MPGVRFRRCAKVLGLGHSTFPPFRNVPWTTSLAKGVEALNKRAPKTRHRRFETIKTSTGDKQSMDQALRKRGVNYNHNLFHDSSMGFPPVFENVFVAGSLTRSLTSLNDDDIKFREMRI